MGAGAVEALGEDLGWLVEQLWRPSAAAGAVRVSIGPVPSGYRAVERFAVVPSLARAEFLVPLRSRRTAWASLSRYNALRPLRTRLPRGALAAGMRLGLAQRLLRDRLTVCVAESAPADTLPALLIGDHLRRLLQVPEVAMAVGIGPANAYRKPTLQLFSPDGRSLGYAKVGWNRVTAGLVRTEAAALRDFGARPPALVSIPPLLASGAWRGLELVVTTPLPAGVRRYRPFDLVPPVAVTREIAALGGIRATRLGDSAYLAAARGQAEAAGGEVGGVLTGYLEAVAQRWGAVPLEFGAWHGDWVSWNLARDGQRLHAWDWEHSGPDVPVGFDLVHWHFQMALVREGRGAVAATLRCAERARPLLAELGLGPDAAEAVVACYLLEIVLRDWRSVAAGASWSPGLYPEMLGVLAERGAAVAVRKRGRAGTG